MEARNLLQARKRAAQRARIAVTIQTTMSNGVRIINSGTVAGATSSGFEVRGISTTRLPAG